jgi:protease II
MNWNRVIFLSLLFGVFNLTLYAQFKYPAARKESFDTLIYQKKLRDDYSWLSRPENEKEMLGFAKAQGKFTEDILDSITGSELIRDVIQKLDDSYNPEEIVVRGVQGTLIYYL